MNELMRRRRALMANRIGGEDGLFKLLGAKTLDTATHYVNFDLTDYSEYTSFVIKVTATLTAEDWVYLMLDGTRKETYTRKLTSITAGQFALVKSGVSPAWVCGMSTSASTAGGLYTNQSGTMPASIGFVPYNSGTNFKSGSVFELYGAKLP